MIAFRILKAKTSVDTSKELKEDYDKYIIFIIERHLGYKNKLRRFSMLNQNNLGCMLKGIKNQKLNRSHSS